MSGRPTSPLTRLRQATQQRLLRPPPELEVDPDLAPEETHAVYCPTRAAHEAVPVCSDVRCGECQLLARELEDRTPDYVWVCYRCTDPFHLLPYWKDGTCDSCGRSSIVLILAVPVENTREE